MKSRLTIETGEIKNDKYVVCINEIKSFLNVDVKFYKKSEGQNTKFVFIFETEEDSIMLFKKLKRKFKKLNLNLLKKEILSIGKVCELCNYASVFGKFCYKHDKAVKLSETCEWFTPLEK